MMLEGACDTHVHVFADARRFPMDPERSYTPGLADAPALEAHLTGLGLSRVVVVQPSIYGTDNRATLDTIAKIGATARGVAVVAEDTTPAELKALDAGGIRGLRLNLAAEAPGLDPRPRVIRAAAICADFGWHLQIFAGLAILQELAGTLESLPVPVMLDHFAGARAELGPSQSGFSAILRLMGSGKAYVKVAAPYLASSLPDMSDCAALAHALSDANPERIVWGSNWPHPTGGTGIPLGGISPFRKVDDVANLERLSEWLDPTAFRACLVDNPARLFF